MYYYDVEGDCPQADGDEPARDWATTHDSFHDVLVITTHGAVKCATSASLKIRGRDNITIGTCNTRTLRAAGKLQELTHEMDGYRWHILGLCEMRWKNFGETTTEEGHKVSFSGKEDKHEHGVGQRLIASKNAQPV